MTGEGRGFVDVAGDEVEPVEAGLQARREERGGRVGANGDLGLFCHGERGFERGFGQVAVHEDEAGFLKETGMLAEQFGRELGHDAHVVHGETQAGARVQHAHVEACGVKFRAEDGGYVHARGGGVFEQFVAGAVLPHHADEFDGLSQPRQILRHVARHAAIGGAYPRRVGGAGLEVGVEPPDDVEGGGAEEEEGHGELSEYIFYSYYWCFVDNLL